MKIQFICIICLTLISCSIFSQKGFQIETDDNKIVIPFQLINNLIFIPINVNGIELNFLLDTGVQETILLSLEDKSEVNLNNIEKIKLSGLGSDKPIEGLQSKDNVFSINGLVDRHHDMYIILDESFNFSAHIGIPVNGIIGYHFFQNNLIEINYVKKRIIVHKDISKIQKKITRKYVGIPFTIEKNKPYTNTLVTLDKKEIKTKLLLDVGNSDALWLFQNVSEHIEVPESNFDDYLGQGFSGDVYGKRTRISKFSLDKFEFNKIIIAMPDSSSVKSVSMVKDRVGSIGSEIFKRFSIIFDYNDKVMYLRKNKYYDSPFHYNLSGIEVQNDGMEWVKETITLNTVINIKQSELSDDLKSDKNNASTFKYKFSLKPVYSIGSVRINSPAELSGLKKGDIIKSINKIPVYRYPLDKINELLKSEDGKWITLEIERNNIPMKFKFQLKSLL